MYECRRLPRIFTYLCRSLRTLCETSNLGLGEPAVIGPGKMSLDQARATAGAVLRP